MSTNIDEAMEAVEHLHECAKSHTGDVDVNGLWQVARSTLTAQQQRIEALEATLAELRTAAEQAIYGSHGNAFLPGQLKRYTQANAKADEALNETDEQE